MNGARQRAHCARRTRSLRLSTYLPAPDLPTNQRITTPHYSIQLIYTPGADLFQSYPMQLRASQRERRERESCFTSYSNDTRNVTHWSWWAISQQHHHHQPAASPCSPASSSLELQALSILKYQRQYRVLPLFTRDGSSSSCNRSPSLPRSKSPATHPNIQPPRLACRYLVRVSRRTSSKPSISRRERAAAIDRAERRGARDWSLDGGLWGTSKVYPLGKPTKSSRATLRSVGNSLTVIRSTIEARN